MPTTPLAMIFSKLINIAYLPAKLILTSCIVKLHAYLDFEYIVQILLTIKFTSCIYFVVGS